MNSSLIYLLFELALMLFFTSIMLILIVSYNKTNRMYYFGLYIMIFIFLIIFAIKSKHEKELMDNFFDGQVIICNEDIKVSNNKAWYILDSHFVKGKEKIYFKNCQIPIDL